jgi:hypothetical protein
MGSLDVRDRLGDYGRIVTKRLLTEKRPTRCVVEKDPVYQEKPECLLKKQKGR